MTRRKKFDRIVHEQGLEVFPVTVYMNIEVGDEHPGYASNNVRASIIDDLEKKMGMRVKSVKIIQPINTAGFIIEEKLGQGLIGALSISHWEKLLKRGLSSLEKRALCQHPNVFNSMVSELIEKTFGDK